jgi:hypothetical protein
MAGFGVVIGSLAAELEGLDGGVTKIARVAQIKSYKSNDW